MMRDFNRRFISISLVALMGITMVMGVCGCKKKGDTQETSSNKGTKGEATVTVVETTVPTEISIEYVPDLNQIRSICELAVMECYYHNVAKGTVEAGTGLIHWAEEDADFWVEYGAYVTLGIDFNEVTMTIRGDEIIVTMPHAQVLGDVYVDPNSVENPIYKPHSFFQNDVNIPASYINQAIAISNDQLVAGLYENGIALTTAEMRAQQLVSNYIDQIMALSGNEYSISFEYVDSVVSEE